MSHRDDTTQRLQDATCRLLASQDELEAFSVVGASDEKAKAIAVEWLEARDEFYTACEAMRDA